MKGCRRPCRRCKGAGSSNAGAQTQQHTNCSPPPEQHERTHAAKRPHLAAHRSTLLSSPSKGARLAHCRKATASRCNKEAAGACPASLPSPLPLPLLPPPLPAAAHSGAGPPLSSLALHAAWSLCRSWWQRWMLCQATSLLWHRPSRLPSKRRQRPVCWARLCKPPARARSPGHGTLS